ncbi:hypothetical protein G6F16_003275 [Rhizopus arrhizus]|nr:hypothetical protein G6F24_007679 [Rhizopus arrhizus]KAG0787706.1 hypothetical protein G6F21_007726 [Rhizopus arrhizus]KAG0809901.1 hypothetical protein G6F20_008401 [Rhizopus arrhizus]KAG0838543.1 hypothetical protein G6F19_003091 [Rhizopus arrhizus]KAG0841931.1 hypothetical protein G6F18_002996 [Rhizopus arrhizus]
MPHIQHDRHQQWYKLSKFLLWKSIPLPVEELSIKTFKAIKKQFLQQGLDYQKQHKNSKLLSCCRLTVSLDPILWLPMIQKEHSRCIRWHLGWRQTQALSPPSKSDADKNARNLMSQHAQPATNA